jgi:hypothetical protein
MRFTRREVLKAIRVEKLVGGRGPIEARWGSYDRGYVYDGKCRVCAVGAVLRQKGIDGYDIPSTFNGIVYVQSARASGNLEGALSDKDWLGALSIKFERLYQQKGAGKVTRKELALFVKKHFPVTFSV